MSCSSQDGNGGDGGCCFVVHGVARTTQVMYVVVKKLESLDICWLTERVKSKTKPRLPADEQGRIS